MQFPIDGLYWEARYRIDNGQNTWVVPFPTNKPINIVSHGDRQAFHYGQYGIHVGQYDQLTFLGSSNHVITAKFIDCRKNSATFGVRFTLEFSPSSEKTLIIPPGVAHTFDGLESVFTINNYKLMLPHPSNLFDRKYWNPGVDIINLPTDVEQIPEIPPNQFEASDIYYECIRKMQFEKLSGKSKTHPSKQFQNILNSKNNNEENFVINKNLDNEVLSNSEKFLKQHVNDDMYPSDTDIFGLGWSKNLHVITGPDSAIFPMLGYAPPFLVDHAERMYVNDSFAIHLGQEDNLTFLGPSSQPIVILFKDCRKNSATKEKTLKLEFFPNPMYTLVIPPGVAHLLINMQNVFTFNRPRFFTNASGNYRPGVDTINIGYANQNFPLVEPNRIAVDMGFYKTMAKRQENLVKSNKKISSSTSKLVFDPLTKKNVKVSYFG